MLNEALTVVIAVINVAVALYVLISARAMFKKPPKWINSVLDEGLEKGHKFVESTLTDVLTPDPESGLNLVDMIAQRFGKGFRMSLLAQKSGEKRHQNMIEGRVFEALKENSPEIKLGMKALEQFGLGDLATPENFPALIQVAQKYGLLGSFLGTNTAKPNNGNFNKIGSM